MPVLDTPPPGFKKIDLKFGPYSASKLNTGNCPARFEGKYIRRDRVIADRVNAARGTAVHWVLEQIAKKRVAGETITPVDIDKWIAESIGKSPAAFGQIDAVREAVHASLKKPSPYLNSKSQLEVGIALALYEEETFIDDAVPARAWVRVPYVDPYAEIQVEVTADQKAFFCCKIDELNFDEVNRSITIVDHKSSPSSSVTPDVAFQLSTYVWAISQLYPGWSVRSSVHYTHPMLNFYSPPELWPDEDIKETEYRILGRVQALESFTEYPALPGSNCDYCHMAMHCPELKALELQNGSYDVNINTESVDDLQRVARKVRVLGNAYDLYNKALKKGAEKLGVRAIAIDGMIYEFRVYESTDWVATDRRIREEAKKAEVELAANPAHPDAYRLRMLVEVKDLDGLLTRFKVNPDLVKGYGSDKMKGLYKYASPELITALQALVVNEKSTKFGGYKS
jgi:hypothetical protein